MSYNRPDRKKRNVPPERPDPFYSEQEDQEYGKYPDTPNLEEFIVPPPEPTSYAVMKDERRFGVKELPEGAFQRKMPKQKTIDSKVESKRSKKTGLTKKL